MFPRFWGALATIAVYTLLVCLFLFPRNVPTLVSVSAALANLVSRDLPAAYVYQRAADKVTFGIKTFGRPALTLRLAESIRIQGYKSPIVIADDGNNNSAAMFSAISNIIYIKLAFNVGLSAGRNAAVARTTTPYYMTLDDDFVFTNKTDIDALVSVIEAHNLDFVSGRLGSSSSVGYFAETDDGIYYCVDLLNNMEKLEHTDCVYTQRTTNFFVARVRFLREHPWRNELKLMEHTVFFAEAYRAGARGAHCPSVTAAHIRPIADAEYTVYRHNTSHLKPLIVKILGKPMIQDCMAVHTIQVI